MHRSRHFYHGHWDRYDIVQQTSGILNRNLNFKKWKPFFKV
jgi:hypothetical protein